MARLLNATGYFSSILAAVCLCLAVLAAPMGEARADEPENQNFLGGPCPLFKSDCLDLLKICPPFYGCVYSFNLGRCTCV